MQKLVSVWIKESENMKMKVNMIKIKFMIVNEQQEGKLNDELK